MIHNAAAKAELRMQGGIGEVNVIMFIDSSKYIVEIQSIEFDFGEVATANISKTDCAELNVCH